MEPIHSHVSLAEELGFKAAAENANADYALAKNLLVAYASYPFITQEAVNRFNSDLRRKTLTVGKDSFRTEHYKTLKFVDISTYPALPPTDVMLKVREAKATNLFSSFQVAYIADASRPTRDPDPIIFGRIEGSTDRFFIAEWGDDVRLADFVQPTTTGASS